MNTVSIPATASQPPPTGRQTGQDRKRRPVAVQHATCIGQGRYSIELQHLAGMLDLHADVARRRNLETLERPLREAAHAASSWSRHVEDVDQLLARKHHSDRDRADARTEDRRARPRDPTPPPRDPGNPTTASMGAAAL